MSLGGRAKVADWKENRAVRWDAWVSGPVGGTPNRRTGNANLQRSWGGTKALRALVQPDRPWTRARGDSHEQAGSKSGGVPVLLTEFAMEVPDTLQA